VAIAAPGRVVLWPAAAGLPPCRRRRGWDHTSIPRPGLGLFSQVGGLIVRLLAAEAKVRGADGKVQGWPWPRAGRQEGRPCRLDQASLSETWSIPECTGVGSRLMRSSHPYNPGRAS
jgi:hypothetical protein